MVDDCPGLMAERRHVVAGFEEHVLANTHASLGNDPEVAAETTACAQTPAAWAVLRGVDRDSGRAGNARAGSVRENNNAIVENNYAVPGTAAVVTSADAVVPGRPDVICGGTAEVPGSPAAVRVPAGSVGGSADDVGGARDVGGGRPDVVHVQRIGMTGNSSVVRDRSISSPARPMS